MSDHRTKAGGAGPAFSVLHPAEHRALRELYAFTVALERHWAALAVRAGVAALADGAAVARALRDELPDVVAERDLFVGPAAARAGRFASARPGPDRLLERNQALRYALLDVQHVITLLGYCQRLAAVREDEPLRRFCGRHARALARHEKALREVALACGDDPDTAIEPAVAGPVGRAGQRVGFVFGSVGEWVDRRAAGR